MKLVLIGFACCYKTSVGKLLAEKLNYTHIDTDEMIVENAGRSIADIFANAGETAFRKMESAALLKVVNLDNAVISCGGGSALLSTFKQLAENATVVWLTASASTVISRLGSAPRPLFDGKAIDDIAAVIDERTSYYARYADLTVSTDGLTSQQAADIVYGKLHLS